MNIWDILILLLVAGMVYLAVRAVRSGKSCCRDCGGCARKCDCAKTQKTDRS